MATRMKREYCSAVSLTVWMRVCGGEGWESMLTMLFLERSLFFVSVLMILNACSAMMHKSHQR
jgi:hypothetical protein